MNTDTIYVFFADGFEEIEAFTAIDVLRRAGLNVKMVSVTEKDVVTGAHDVPVICDSLFDDNDYSDAALLLLPGGMPGAGTLSNHEGLKALVTEFITTNKPVAAICAAPMLFGKLGLAEGRKVTCYPGFSQYMQGAECTEEMVVIDGNIITGKGPGAAMQFTLAIVEKLCGKEKVAELKDAMCIQN